MILKKAPVGCKATYTEGYAVMCANNCPERTSCERMGFIKPPTAGRKDDTSKDRPSLILEGFPLVLKELVRLAEFGAKKYGEHNWRKVPDGVQRYKEAAYRHMLEGANLDSESGLDQRVHMIWSWMAHLELELRDKEVASEKVPL